MTPRTTPWLEYAELAMLFFLHGAALGSWFVPLSAVLDAHNLQSVKAYAYATSAVGALVAPLIFGAIADRHVAPVRVLRALGVATGLAMATAAASIQYGWPSGVVLFLIQIHALCSAPTWGLSCTIIFARLRNARRQFGPIRAVATFGWMSGCWMISSLGADRSPVAGYCGALIWLSLVAFTFVLPSVDPPRSTQRQTVGQRLGLDALQLLKHRDHRVVFVMAALFSIPMAAFYPYTPPHLRSLGLTHITAWMTLGQVTEIVAMLGLGAMMTRWRLKWIFVAGLTFGVFRYALCTAPGALGLLAGITLHGCSYAMVFITAQIYLDERVDPAWRARAQALFTLTTSGLGNLAGYLGVGAWFSLATHQGITRWPLFWTGLSLGALGVLIYFLATYHGRKTPPPPASAAATP